MSQDARRFAASHRVAVRVGATAIVALAALVIPMTPGYGGTPAAKTTASRRSKAAAPGLQFRISFPSSVSTTAQTGHIILIVSKDTSAEPRFQYHVYSQDVQPGFGLDVNDLAPGKPAVIDGTVLGWPLKSVNDLPAGDYQVQAILNRYETYHRADGHTLELPPEKGEGQHWYSKPGHSNRPQRPAGPPGTPGGPPGPQQLPHRDCHPSRWWRA